MEAIIARVVQLLLALSGAYLVALWFVLVVWTYRDIETRSRSVVTQIFSTLVVVLFYVPGLLLYMILRPKETLDSAFQRSLEEEYLLQDLEELPLCQSCQRYVEDDFILCPHCHAKLRDECASCGRLVHLRWSLCPYCGADQSEKAAAARERVEVPAARWRSAGVPRRRTTPAIVARPAAVLAQPQPPALVGTDLTPPAAEELTIPALSVVRAASGTPVRLFDRRKTKAANRNGIDRAFEDLAATRTTSHVSGNGHSAANGRHAPYLVNAPATQNGHHANGRAADGADTTEAGELRTREMVPARSSSERD